MSALSTTDATSVSALGTTIAVEPLGPDADVLAEAVRTAWSACLTTSPPQHALRVHAGSAPDTGADVSAPTVAAAMEALTQRITIDAIGRRAGELVMLHAGAVADPTTGRAVALVGPSGMGKTTATRTLAAAGLAYVTDETVAIDEAGGIVAYPKPFSVLDGTNPVKHQLSPDELGFTIARSPLTLAGILLLARSQSDPTVLLHPQQTPYAVAYLAEQSSFASAFDKPLHRLASVIHLAGGAHAVTYAEAADLEPVVRTLLAGGER